VNSAILLADIGNIGLLACAALTTASVAAYAIRGRGSTTMPWWKSPFGLHLMCFMIAFAIVLDESAVFLITSGQVLLHRAPPLRPDWFAWTRVISFTTLIPAVLAWRLWIILRPPGGQ
jgi:hypothetical protein